MLGIDANRLARRNAEELGVELGDVPQKPAPARVHLAGHGGIGIVVVVDVPAVGGDFLDGVDAIAKRLPKGLGILAAWEPASHADHRDRFAAGALAGRQLGLHLFEKIDCVLQRSELLRALPERHRNLHPPTLTVLPSLVE